MVTRLLGGNGVVDIDVLARTVERLGAAPDESERELALARYSPDGFGEVGAAEAL